MRGVQSEAGSMIAVGQLAAAGPLLAGLAAYTITTATIMPHQQFV